MRKHFAAASSIAVIAAQAWIGVGAPPAAAAEGASNGVYGGYVASSAWFAAMRSTAANQAMVRSLTGQRGTAPLPADYVEMAGRITFPGGNPFPRQRIPDLRIRCRDPRADRVERAPSVDQDGRFYTVFKRGQYYDLSWMGYFGGLEKFASLFVRVEGPAQRSVTIPYKAGGATPQDPPGGVKPKPAPGITTSPRPRGPGQGQQPAPGKQTVSNPPTAGTPPQGPQNTPAPGPSTGPLNVNEFDLADFPKTPTTFEEQRILDDIHSATTPAFKARAHGKLARYYERKGIAARARSEREKEDYWQKAVR